MSLRLLIGFLSTISLLTVTTEPVVGGERLGKRHNLEAVSGCYRVRSRLIVRYGPRAHRHG
jgi:hypothetical protein